MSVDLTKLVNLQGLVKFKQRQDTQNEDTFVKFVNISESYNNTVSIPIGNKNSVISVLTEGSSINAANLTGTVASGVTVPASTISGTIGISNLPPSALERLIYVDLEEPDQEQPNKTSRLGLTTNDVQLGDTVKVVETGKMYMVVDTTKLDLEAGYEVYTAGGASSVPWSGVTGKPSFGTGANDFATGNHTHGNISTDGKIGSTANLPLITTTDGAITTGSFGTSANTFAEGNHVHGNLTNDGKIGSTANLPLITTTNGAVTTGSFGTSANTFAEGNHTHGSDKVVTMTSYAKPNSLTSGHEAIETTDTLNAAVGKLEYKLDETIANVASNAEIDEEIFGIVDQNGGGQGSVTPEP